ncbi:hypothetical protein [Mesorhizobium sp. B2-4-6]|uniref:hypothetical protein n=1 Tax=Mesorhizobium sp. B2-4-6 TaxID=2589943 RepID=UPI00112CA4CE|nr:hypothetical protein [Mesorhizobium sp. B2-4-6]TPL40651.1 hypothetical protein FJ957_25820 [Mesorhizobium sp. B2-4-6]
MAANCYGVDCTGWVMLHPRATPDMLGYVPRFLQQSDARPAREQFDERYEYGGWSPNAGFNLLEDGRIQYPGDPPLPVVAEFTLRSERVVAYPGAVFAIIQPDGRFEVARMD